MFSESGAASKLWGSQMRREIRYKVTPKVGNQGFRHSRMQHGTQRRDLQKRAVWVIYHFPVRCIFRRNQEKRIWVNRLRLYIDLCAAVGVCNIQWLHSVNSHQQQTRINRLLFGDFSRFLFSVYSVFQLLIYTLCLFCLFIWLLCLSSSLFAFVQCACLLVCFWFGLCS